MGISLKPRIIILPKGSMPMTWRFRKHYLGLPQGVENWTSEQVRCVLRHELAHVKREDCATSWIANLSLALFWPHPLVWPLKRQLNESREAACDDLAIKEHHTEQERSNYAENLLRVVTNHSRRTLHLPTTVTMANNTKGIKNRIESILDETQNRRKISKKTVILSLPGWATLLIASSILTACNTRTTPQKINNLEKKLSKNDLIKIHDLETPLSSCADIKITNSHSSTGQISPLFEGAAPKKFLVVKTCSALSKYS